jgi:hypothetical protein
MHALATIANSSLAPHQSDSFLQLREIFHSGENLPSLVVCSVWTTAGSSRPGNWCSCNACISNTGRTGTLCRIFQIQLQSPYSPDVPCMRDHLLQQQQQQQGVILVILTSSQDDRWERADGILVEFYNPPPPPSLHI